MNLLNNKNKPEFKDITDIWNVSKKDLGKISEIIISIENNLHEKHKGHYFDYQLVDDFFHGHSDIEKAMIFVYGQMVHDKIYKKNL